MPLFATMLLGLSLSPTFGTPTVMPFQGGKRAAFSLEFDDSMDSQVRNALPLLAQYRIPATFFINPGRTNYPASRDVWEKAVPAAGHELGDHTMHHGDTVGAVQGAVEIGDAAKAIERALGHPVLTPFGIPGGVRWEIPEDDFRRILRENRLFFPGREDFYQDGQGDIVRFPQRALATSSWHRLAFHGVGGEWLSTSVESLASVLRFLDSHREEMWLAPTGAVWKYEREREALQTVALTPRGTRSFDLSLRFDRSKIEPFDLYDVPLTVRIAVPPSWTRASVTMDGRRRQVAVREGFLMIDLPPQTKRATLERRG